MREQTESSNGPLTPAHLLERLQWRYACRKYDTIRMIPPDVWEALEQSLVLTASSFGLQPWKFLIVTDKEFRKQLYPLSHNQQPVLDASHLVIFTVTDEMRPEDIVRWCLRRKELRGERMTADDVEGMREALTRELIHGPRKNSLYEWAAEQAHIALGNFLTCCALLGVDASPMGAIKAREFDECLGLPGKRLRTVVLCAAGYRAPEETGTGGRKERFARSAVIEHVGSGNF
jgi:nitroreductase